MNRAERRRREREERKAQKRQAREQGQNEPSSRRQDSDPCPNGHPEQSAAFSLYGTPPHRCPRCGEVPQFEPGGFDMSADLAPNSYGMPQRVSRQWIVDNSEKDEGLGAVPIPMERQDELITHAIYYPECPHFDLDFDESCSCEEDDAVMWELAEFQG